MKLHELKKNQISRSRKRVGRGIAAGGGKTAGRGTKGQKSRSGYNIPRKFEGGQTPLIMRLHKLPGFKSQKPKALEISLDEISNHYIDGEVVSLQSLQEKGMIKKGERVKILGNGKLRVKVSLLDVPASKNAKSKFSRYEEKKSDHAYRQAGHAYRQAGKMTKEKPSNRAWRPPAGRAGQAGK